MRDDHTTTVGTSIKKPNFLIVGAAKSGTTSLWHYLRQHPQVYMSPRKHTRFFSFEAGNPNFRGPAPKRGDPRLPYAVFNLDDYHALFDGATSETAIGEASHSYLYRRETAGRIRAYAPSMKLIAVLRNPAERAYSHYNQMLRDGCEPLGEFVQALRAEEARVKDDWWPDYHYVKIGLYFEQLKQYFDLFGRDQIGVYLYEDLVSDPLNMLQEIFQFLGVDDTFIPEATVRYNASGIPRNRMLHACLQKLRHVKPVAERLVPESHYRRLLRMGSGFHNRNLTKPQLSSELRKRVTDDYFREDITRVEHLIQRSLSAWL